MFVLVKKLSGIKYIIFQHKGLDNFFCNSPQILKKSTQFCDIESCHLTAVRVCKFSRDTLISTYTKKKRALTLTQVTYYLAVAKCYMKISVRIFVQTSLNPRS